MKPRSTLRGEVVNKARLAFIMGVTIRVVEGWVAQGCPVLKAATGRGDDWEFATAQVIDWLRKGMKPEGEVIDLNAERARLAKEQADGQSLKNQVARGELLPAETVENTWMSAIGRCRALLLGIPTSSAGRIVLLARQNEGAKDAEREVRELLTSMIDGAVAELSNTNFNEIVEDEDEASSDGAAA
jgi:phage terminase Nu1 subunit (DNA packaging protein)